MSKKNVDIEKEVQAAKEKPKHNVWDVFWRGIPAEEAEATVEKEEKEEGEKPGFRWF
ncbi:hypothetical protein ACQUWN_13465 [Rossellomorea aquimaris]|uniref:hypothetical protein n=1 Tax=Rossellomorea TaxID=2837508 RepID=UPI0016536F70|nr:hypothetical protein [Rossellomorea vietnamensis]